MVILHELAVEDSRQICVLCDPYGVAILKLVLGQSSGGSRKIRSGGPMCGAQRSRKFWLINIHEVRKIIDSGTLQSDSYMRNS